LALEPDKILHNRYRIIKLLGQGGFGEVYQAWDQTLNGPCALKRNLQLRPEVRRQFKKEAQMLFNLRHPSLPKVYDYFEGFEDEQYLVMEFIEGEDLQTRVKRLGMPTVGQTLEWIDQVCDALTYLHTRQPPVVHRDIKPANLILTSEGRVVLVDFGIAKIGDIQQVTHSGAQGVTPGYSPPEQYGPSGTNTQSDVYALGATTYMLLTGQVPDDAYLITLGERSPIQPAHQVNPQVPMQVSQAVEIAMRLKRTERMRSVSAFQSALRKLESSGKTPVLPLEKKPVVGQPPHQTNKTQTLPHPKLIPQQQTSVKKWIVVALGVGIICVIFTFLAWWISQYMNEAARKADNNNLSLFSTTQAAQYSQDAAAEGDRQSALFITHTVLARTGQETSTDNPRPTDTYTPTPINTHTPSPDPFIPPACTFIGQMWQSPKDGMKLLCIPEGRFTMGSGNGYEDEIPVHAVILSAFWIDHTEVTNAMFTQFIAETGYQTSAEKEGWGYAFSGQDWEKVTGANWQHPHSPDSDIAGLDDHPVVQVSWEDAVAYCAWAKRELPSEAEWEKAARGADGRTYPWGNDELAGNLLNFADVNLEQDWADLTIDDGYEFTAPVGRYPDGASPYQVLDLAGNVWEWVQDWYASDYYSSRKDWIDPLGPETGDFRVLRSGSWDNDSRDVRVSVREWYPPSDRSVYVGFRCTYSP
jgi:formylglycine-generating enzyme required for sulfatase activity/predicted Ser/Thr protein kinase